MRMPSKMLSSLAACLALSACGEPDQAAQEPGRSLRQIDRSRLAPPRGVLLIVIDTLRSDHLGIYNPDHPFSPALDAFAHDAIVFDAMYASSSWTRSSIASIFSSRYPTEINIVDKNDALADEVLTVAEVFSANGWQTQGVNTNANSGPAWNMGQGFDDYGPPHRVKWAKGLGRRKYSAERVTAEILDWLEHRESDKPVFLYALYVDPHEPYFTYPELMDRPEPPGRFDGSKKGQLQRLDQLSEGERTRDDEARIKYQYESEVRNTDRWIGRLLEGLKARKLYDDWVIAVTADHGEELWNRGERNHGTSLFDEMVRVPLIIRFPSSWSLPPRRVASPAGHVDIAPTLLAAAGIDVPDEFVGIDLWDDAEDYLLPIPERVVYSEMDRHGRNFDMVSDGNAKLWRNRVFENDGHLHRHYFTEPDDNLAWLSYIHFGDYRHGDAIKAANPGFFSAYELPEDGALPAGVELAIPDRDPEDWGPRLQFFDLQRDAREKHNTYDEANELQQRMYRQLREIAAGTLARQGTRYTIIDSQLDQETLKELRGLGYIQ